MLIQSFALRRSLSKPFRRSFSYSNVKVLEESLYLSSCSSFKNSQSKFQSHNLHPLLQKGLEANDFINTTEIQEKLLTSLSTSTSRLAARNTLLASESGSGKTLAYLLPLLNRIFHEKDSQQSLKLDNRVFLNAEDLYYERKLECKNLTKEDLIERSQMRGAIIIAPSRELLNQVYRLIRCLDTTNTLRINRVG